VGAVVPTGWGIETLPLGAVVGVVAVVDGVVAVVVVVDMPGVAAITGARGVKTAASARATDAEGDFGKRERMAGLLSDRCPVRSDALQCVAGRHRLFGRAGERVRTGNDQSSSSAGQSSICRPGVSSSLDQRACRHGSKSVTGTPSSSISRRGGSLALRGSILAFIFMAALFKEVNLPRI
jgi:hypothetical protein